MTFRSKSCFVALSALGLGLPAIAQNAFLDLFDAESVAPADRGGRADEPYVGYNLFAPLGETTTYLMDNDGNFVHTWESAYRPGLSVYLLENGDLLRTGSVVGTAFPGGGGGGVVQQFDWDGDLVWEFQYSSSTHLSHHDIELLPNGNVLMIAWETKTRTEALAAGRNPALVGPNGLYPDTVIEVQPTGADSGQIVWEWRVWDHLIQDYSASQDNYGVVADHPELINLNFSDSPNADWNHTNAVDYNAELDQILISVHNFSEIWIIDHSTTTAEAAGHTGGNSGMGGDLLYRWGNPRAYDAGTTSDQQLFIQHDAEWIADGLPGAGNILVFNNGKGRSDGNYSSVDEIMPPVNADGSYGRDPGAAFGPVAPVWQYVADTPTDFYADHISGAQRLPNGNTLICEGTSAHFFEVTGGGAIVWYYWYSLNAQAFRVDRYARSIAGYPVGDLNCDDVLDLFDIDPFVLALSDPDGYGLAYPTCDRLRADVNEDGTVDLFDIDPFVELLSGG